VNASLKNKKVLITCGPTWVALDEIRVISNQSTGEMGHFLAEEFRNAGAKVTLLEGPVTHAFAAQGIEIIKFNFYDELLVLIGQELIKDFNIVVHAAAVSDFRPAAKSEKKTSSQLPYWDLRLVPTLKIIDMMKKLNPKIFLVGFKLEPQLKQSLLKTKTRDLFERSQCDLVVANTMERRSYQGYIVDSSGRILSSQSQKRGLAKNLVKKMKDLL